MLISSGFSVNNYELARKAIFEQITDIQAGKISDAEFYTAQRSIVSSYRQLYDNPLDMQAFLGDRALFGITDSIDDAISKLLTVSKSDVINLAQRIKLGASYFIKGTLNASNTENEEEQYE
jgi:predicted Zn-dependent peptidase